MKITRSAEAPSERGSADWFTGAVRIDNRSQLPAPARLGASIVTFEPGGRTRWHTHPLGQLIIVTAGEGWVQREGGPKELVHPGDTVFFEPGERHWHGATDRKAMVHVAVHEALDGSAVTWQEPVADSDYLG